MATMKIYQQEPVVDTLWRQGDRLAVAVNKAIAEHELQDYFMLAGRPCNLVYMTLDREKKRSQAFRTLFLQEIIKRGLLAPSLIVSYSHTDADIDRTAEVFYEALGVYRQAIENGVDNYLVGRPVKPVWRRFN